MIATVGIGEIPQASGFPIGWKIEQGSPVVTKKKSPEESKTGEQVTKLEGKKC